MLKLCLKLLTHIKINAKNVHLVKQGNATFASVKTAQSAIFFINKNKIQNRKNKKQK